MVSSPFLQRLSRNLLCGARDCCACISLCVLARYCFLNISDQDRTFNFLGYLHASRFLSRPIGCSPGRHRPPQTPNAVQYQSKLKILPFLHFQQLQFNRMGHFSWDIFDPDGSMMSARHYTVLPNASAIISYKNYKCASQPNQGKAYHPKHFFSRHYHHHSVQNSSLHPHPPSPPRSFSFSSFRAPSWLP